MVKRGRKQRFANKGSYTLADVKRKINNRQLVIHINAERRAFQLFGWGVSDIEDAYRELQPKHFCKTVPSIYKYGVYLDYYKATIKGEKIFTHFYIDDETGLLVINSLHGQ